MFFLEYFLYWDNEWIELSIDILEITENQMELLTKEMQRFSFDVLEQIKLSYFRSSLDRFLDELSHELFG